MVQNLEDGFLTELADMLNAEHQIIKMLPKMVQAAESQQLRQALQQHLEETEEQASRVERVFKLFNRTPANEECEGIQGILKEGKELLEKTGSGPVRDAMLIAAAQKVEHYEIASYGTLCAWADELGEGRALRLLEETLNEERTADRKLTRIAESMANEGARDQQQGRQQGQFPGGRQVGQQWNEDDRGMRGGRSVDQGRQGREMQPARSGGGNGWERDLASPRFGERGRNRGRSEDE